MKKEDRIKYLNIRKNIKNKKDKSYIIFNKIINLSSFFDSKVICLYSSLDEEVDTFELIKYSLENKKEVYLPKVINESEMEFYQVNSLDELEKGTFNIKEPTSNNILNKEIDLIIVPGVCFDRNKNRIGFGKGYYDKYLNNHKCKTIVGICFDEQLINDSIETNVFDKKMDLIITNKENVL